MTFDVSTLAPSILIRSPSFLHVTRTSIKVLESSHFGPIPSLAAELAAIDRVATRQGKVREIKKISRSGNCQGIL